MNRRRLLQRLRQGALNNVAFSDFTNLIEGFGFEFDHIVGSHHIYRRPDVSEKVNVQPSHSEAKPYQLRQFLQLVDRYELEMEDDA